MYRVKNEPIFFSVIYSFVFHSKSAILFFFFRIFLPIFVKIDLRLGSLIDRLIQDVGFLNFITKCIEKKEMPVPL